MKNYKPEYVQKIINDSCCKQEVLDKLHKTNHKTLNKFVEKHNLKWSFKPYNLLDYASGFTKKEIIKICKTSFNKREILKKLNLPSSTKYLNILNIFLRENNLEDLFILYYDKFINKNLLKDLTPYELMKLHKNPNINLNENIKGIGYIYKITNLITKQVYIGQTSNYYELRWKQHLYDYNKEYRHSKNNKLYNSMMKYGAENFKFELIESCNISELDKKEKFYIKKYDSFLNGLNSDLGGGGRKINTTPDEIIIDKYYELGTIGATAKHFNHSRGYIKNILLKNNIENKSAAMIQKEQGKKIYQYDLDHKLIHIFLSKTDAGQWLIDNHLSNAKNANNAGYYIKRNLQRNNHIFQGYYWSY